MIVLSTCEGINHNSQEGQRNERGEDHQTKQKISGDRNILLYAEMPDSIPRRHGKPGGFEAGSHP